MDKNNQAKLITCILPKGKGLSLVKALDERGVHTMNFAFARGSDIQDPPGKKGLPEEVEKEIVTIVARTPQEADDLFSFAFDKADMNQIGGGLIYMTSLGYTTPYQLPDIRKEESLHP